MLDGEGACSCCRILASSGAVAVAIAVAIFTRNQPLADNRQAVRSTVSYKHRLAEERNDGKSGK